MKYIYIDKDNWTKLIIEKYVFKVLNFPYSRFL